MAWPGDCIAMAGKGHLNQPPGSIPSLSIEPSINGLQCYSSALQVASHQTPKSLILLTHRCWLGMSHPFRQKYCLSVCICKHFCFSDSGNP